MTHSHQWEDTRMVCRDCGRTAQEVFASCPECAKRLPKLTPASAPVEGCACRICRWLRDNAEYKGPKRG